MAALEKPKRVSNLANRPLNKKSKRTKNPFKTYSKDSASKSVSKLKKEADKWWSKYVRLRDSDQFGIAECITCKVKKPHTQMQCGHFVTRGANGLRYNEENTNSQCVGCNMFKSGEQYLYSVALDLKYGDGTAKQLMNQRAQTKTFKAQELEDIIKYSKEQVKWFEDNNHYPRY